MDLPAIVTIDLYPDMKAKGLGSGTTWTPANTVTNTHIAEVYNESTRVDSNHELAHIFTYHFGSGGGVLREPFAVSCEAYYDIPKMMEAARQRLSQGKLGSLESILLSSNGTWSDDTLWSSSITLSSWTWPSSNASMCVWRRPRSARTWARSCARYTGPICPAWKDSGMLT
jgi:hypothetical protein